MEAPAPVWEIAAYAQCGGINCQPVLGDSASQIPCENAPWSSTVCSDDSVSCQRQDDYFWQCLPTDTPAEEPSPEEEAAPEEASPEEEASSEASSEEEASPEEALPEEEASPEEEAAPEEASPEEEAAPEEASPEEEASSESSSEEEASPAEEASPEEAVPEEETSPEEETAPEEPSPEEEVSPDAEAAPEADSDDSDASEGLSSVLSSAKAMGAKALGGVRTMGAKAANAVKSMAADDDEEEEAEASPAPAETQSAQTSAEVSEPAQDESTGTQTHDSSINEIAAYAQCGGINCQPALGDSANDITCENAAWSNAVCLDSTTSCQRVDDYMWQCLPADAAADSSPAAGAEEEEDSILESAKDMGAKALGGAKAMGVKAMAAAKSMTSEEGEVSPSPEATQPAETSTDDSSAEQDDSTSDQESSLEGLILPEEDTAGSDDLSESNEDSGDLDILTFAFNMECLQVIHAFLLRVLYVTLLQDHNGAVC